MYKCPHCGITLNDPAFVITGQTLCVCGEIVDIATLGVDGLDGEVDHRDDYYFDRDDDDY